MGSVVDGPGDRRGVMGNKGRGEGERGRRGRGKI